MKGNSDFQSNSTNIISIISCFPKTIDIYVRAHVQGESMDIDTEEYCFMTFERWMEGFWQI